MNGSSLHLQVDKGTFPVVAELSRDDAKEQIRAAGLRATAPRVAVLRLLASTDRPLSHTDVVEAIGCTDWDQATLYRNLLKLVEVNLARVVSKVGGVSRYEARGDDDGAHLHPHFSCRTCGCVECLPDAKLTGPVHRRWNRSLETSELQLIGDCPGCLATQKSKQASGARKRTKRRS
ncbi:MAG: transcriptional repressor [Myxococcales bacterium]|nr:transcriptional repressor [Myxococcales bacterium]MDD9964833.1 transcriptional repressor [Myxococcales bacterium]